MAKPVSNGAGSDGVPVPQGAAQSGSVAAQRVAPAQNVASATSAASTPNAASARNVGLAPNAASGANAPAAPCVADRAGPAISAPASPGASPGDGRDRDRPERREECDGSEPPAGEGGRQSDRHGDRQHPRRADEPSLRPRHHPVERHREPGHHVPHVEPGRPRTSGPLYAALDLGTNNCRLLVAEPWRQGFRVVDAFSRIVRLGEGLSRSGRLSDAAQSRAIDALRVCRSKLDARGIVRARLVATEACRAAENGVEFLERVRREAGLTLEILTRETEARLAVTGCANLVDWTADGVLLFDIGGGSSELVWMEFGDGRRAGGDPTRHIRAWTSLPVGVVTLSERHGGVAVGPAVFEDMVADVDALLSVLPDWAPLAERLVTGRYHMLGTSGTVTTLAGVHLGLKRYDRRRVDGTWLSDDEVGAMIDRLLAMEFEDRVANPCIGGDRADLVLAGCAILEAIRRRWRCGRLRVADRGLREGMLTELMIGDGVWRRPNRWPRRPNDEGRER